MKGLHSASISDPKFEIWRSGDRFEGRKFTLLIKKMCKKQLGQYTERYTPTDVLTFDTVDWGEFEMKIKKKKKSYFMH